MVLVSTSVILVLALLLVSGVWVFASLFSVGAFTLSAFRDLPVGHILSNLVWNATTTPELLALPLFILMAEILFRTRLSALLFQGLAPWTTSLPGGLLHTNVIGCTLFAAICGSSAATAITVGRITLSELLKRGYSRSLSIGSLAGAGTLGFLIPPSIIMIIYGVLTKTSIIKLFIAGILPGLGLAFTYMVVIAVRSGSARHRTPATTIDSNWGARFRGLLLLFPVTALIVAVVGSMYFGIATPTESAALGVVGSLVISAAQRCFTWKNISAALLGAARTSSMMGMILAGGIFLSVALGYVGLPQYLARLVASFGLGPFETVLLVTVFYIILGCFLDGTSMLVMTVPITLPLITAVGFDRIWFGIFLVLVIEMAQITPPVGFNLFVIRSLTGDGLGRIAQYAFPFFLATVGYVLLITVFPEIATYLPAHM